MVEHRPPEAVPLAGHRVVEVPPVAVLGASAVLVPWLVKVGLFDQHEALDRGEHLQDGAVRAPHLLWPSWPRPQNREAHFATVVEVGVEPHSPVPSRHQIHLRWHGREGVRKVHVELKAPARVRSALRTRDQRLHQVHPLGVVPKKDRRALVKRQRGGEGSQLLNQPLDAGGGWWAIALGLRQVVMRLELGLAKLPRLHDVAVVNRRPNGGGSSIACRRGCIWAVLLDQSRSPSVGLNDGAIHVLRDDPIERPHRLEQGVGNGRVPLVFLKRLEELLVLRNRLDDTNGSLVERAVAGNVDHRVGGHEFPEQPRKCRPRQRLGNPCRSSTSDTHQPHQPHTQRPVTSSIETVK
eukprot:m.90805 g.90805  ORF g.90805 m.90805 type:complete len:352 (-) comp11885_c0_seq2:138-1193(-)